MIKTIKLTSKYSDDIPFFSAIPERKELEKIAISQLITIATSARYNRNPFKAALVEYILSLGKLR